MQQIKKIMICWTHLWNDTWITFLCLFAPRRDSQVGGYRMWISIIIDDLLPLSPWRNLLTWQCALFPGLLSLITFWHSEQRIYRAKYEKTKDKFTITTDDPRYQLARMNNKMSQVNTPGCGPGPACRPPDLRHRCMRSSTGLPAIAWLWKSIHRDKFLSPPVPVSHHCLSLSIRPEQAFVISATQEAAGVLSWVSRTLLYLCHQRGGSATHVPITMLIQSETCPRKPLSKKEDVSVSLRAQMWTNSSSPPSVTAVSYLSLTMACRVCMCVCISLYVWTGEV